MTKIRLSAIGLFILLATINLAFAQAKIIAVKPSQQQFDIRLKSNPTTGYQWSLLNYDRNLISLSKHQYIRPNKNLIGAPGYEVWTFRLLPAFFKNARGSLIKLEYKRPWEKAMKGKTVTYEIKPAK